MIHMKCQVLISMKNKKKNRMLSAVCVINVLRVNYVKAVFLFKFKLEVERDLSTSCAYYLI